MSLRRALPILLLAALFAAAATAQNTPRSGIDDVLHYIDNAWTTLSRSQEHCSVVFDERKRDVKQYVYFPADQPLPPAAADLEKRCGITAQQLPKPITGPGQVDAAAFSPHGLLYLPNPYVVPGGFFNEMYGWDSYFIIRGLLEADKVDLARGQVENFFYEIEHYGSILNANRTYFLSRSQPPFLSAMVMAVYEKQQDEAWLKKAYPYIVRDYRMWTSPAHLAGSTGLSRYYDYNDGPTPEIASIGDPYYAEVITALTATGEANDYVAGGRMRPPAPQGKSTSASTTVPENPELKPIGPQYTVTSCIEGGKCAKAATLQLTADYYKGDRSMRESGYDISSRFGPYSGHTHHYAPVCLNSLLYQTERNLQRIAELTGEPGVAREWSDRAALRQQRMNKLLWNQGKGMYFDWDFTTNRQSDYVYATTFFPLWAGLASDAQAKALIANVKQLEQAGGIVMSPYATRLQWDYPYGWAPSNLIAIEGLRRYKAQDEADRLSLKFLSMIVENFRKDGTIREKYNVVERSDEMDVSAGYHVNVIGFGWTNGTFLTLLHELPESKRSELK
jgi:alpha,alpha-trehalase